MTNNRRFPARTLRVTLAHPIALLGAGLLAGLLATPSTALAGPVRKVPNHRQYADDPGIQKSIEGVLD